MQTYAEEKRRRIAQFANALSPMHQRTTNLVQDCCYLLIEEQLEIDTPSKLLKETTKVEVASSKVVSDNFSDGFTQYLETEGWSDEGWLQSDQSRRFVQFVFLERHFEMDLPRPMLRIHEARTLLERRSGFYFLGDRPGSPANESVIKVFHPLRKAYIHGDNHSAAEDIAYIFFELWRFPIDTRLYLTTFGGSYCWESGSPLD